MVPEVQFSLLKRQKFFFYFGDKSLPVSACAILSVDTYVLSTASAEPCVKKSKKVDSTNDEWALAVPKQDIRGMLRHY